MDLKLEKIKEILLKPQESRNSSDIKLLGTTVSNVKFFDSLKEHKSVYRELCMYLAYEHYKKNQFIFKEGEYGDKFYILLKGEAKVLITLKQNDQLIQKEVLTYKDGSTFGELALTDNKPRAASIQTNTESHFAVLDKFNYNRILSSLLNSKRTELIEYLKQHSYFKQLTKVSLLKLSYCFEEKNLTKDQIIFKEGDQLEYIYFIKEGEVKLSRNIKIQIIDSSEPVTKGTLFLKKHCWKKADIGILESGGLIGINDLESEKHSATCRVLSKHAKILQVTIQSFRKRMNNDETLLVLNRGKTMRNMLIQDNTKSVTKILKERITSPYKKIFAQENLSDSRVLKKNLVLEEDRMKVVNEIGRKSRRNSSSGDVYDNKAPKFSTFDVNLERKTTFKVMNRRTRTTMIKDYNDIKDDSNIEEEGKEKIFNYKRKSLNATTRIAQRKTKSIDCEDITGKIKKKKYNITFLITKMNPFGKAKSINPTPKIEEPVNIHTQSKRILTLRPNTPKNWSFMNFNSPLRRPISTQSRVGSH